MYKKFVIIFIDELYTVSWLYILLWTLSSSYWFYGTGHNPSFPAIHWNAAFVLQSNVENNTWLPGFFILANTFFSHAVHAFLLPVIYRKLIIVCFFYVYSFDLMIMCFFCLLTQIVV